MAQRSSRAFVFAVLVVAASTAASAQVIKGCVDPAGGLRVINAAQSCKPSESALSWNAVGPQGPVGPAGPQGPIGPQGPAGAGELPPQVVATVTIDNLTPFSAYQFTGGITVAESTGGSSGAGAGKTTLSPVVLAKAIDAATATFFQKAVTGLAIPKVTIAIAGTQLQVVLSNVIVSGDTLAPLKGSNTIFEQVTLNYEKLELIF